MHVPSALKRAGSESPAMDHLGPSSSSTESSRVGMVRVVIQTMMMIKAVRWSWSLSNQNYLLGQKRRGSREPTNTSQSFQRSGQKPGVLLRLCRIVRLALDVQCAARP